MSEEERVTRVSRVIDDPRHEVYAALVDPDAVAAWLPPEGMTGDVDAFESRPDGRFSMTLTYDDPTTGPGGKTSADCLVRGEGLAKEVSEDLEADVVAHGGRP